MNACLRCGDLVAAEKLRVRGVALCARCLEGGLVVPRLSEVAAPLSVIVRRTWPSFASAFAGAALALVFWRGPDGLETVLEASLGFLLGYLVMHIAAVRRFHFAGNDEWKELVSRKLGVDPALFTFVVLVRPGTALRDVIFGEPGLVALGDDGLEGGDTFRFAPLEPATFSAARELARRFADELEKQRQTFLAA